MDKKTIKKLKRQFKYLVIIALVAFITYWGQGNEYVREGLAMLKTELESRLTPVENKKSTEDITANKRLTGKIVRVADGDTVTLLDNNGKKRKIRLDGIDCPEIGQEHGDEAREYVEKLTMNKYASVAIIGIDQYDRILGVLYIDDMNVNENLLTTGLAWVYKYNKNTAYHALEKKAREKKINIWSNPNSIDPHTWRKTEK